MVCKQIISHKIIPLKQRNTTLADTADTILGEGDVDKDSHHEHDRDTCTGTLSHLAGNYFFVSRVQ